MPKSKKKDDLKARLELDGKISIIVEENGVRTEEEIDGEVVLRYLVLALESAIREKLDDARSNKRPVSRKRVRS